MGRGTAPGAGNAITTTPAGARLEEEPVSLPAVIVGAILALLLDTSLRRAGRVHHRSWATGLAVATAVYVGFALRTSASWAWLGLEIVGVAVFLPSAVLGWRGGVRALAAGWLAHVAWDLLLHGPGTPFVPAWYPWLCLGFDVVAAVVVLLPPAVSGLPGPRRSGR